MVSLVDRALRGVAGRDTLPELGMRSRRAMSPAP